MADPRATGIAQLEDLVGSMRGSWARGLPPNLYAVADAAGVAAWVGRRDLAAELSEWLRTAPIEDLARGVLTNAPVDDPEVFRPRVRAPEPYDDAARSGIEAFVAQVTREVVRDDHGRECALVAAAFAGHDEEALRAARETGLSERRVTALPLLRIVATVERARRGDPGWDRHVAEIRDLLPVARGLVGLVPWPGYPFADY